MPANATTPACTGCRHLTARHRRGNPQTWCQRYARLATSRCLDYQSKRSGIFNALRYVAHSSIK